MKKWIACLSAIMFVFISNTYTIAINEDTVPPKIIFTNPNNNSTNVELNRIFSFHFNEPVFIGGVFSKIKLEDDQKESVQIKKSLYQNQLIIKVDTDLAPNTKYTLTIPAKAVTDKSGNNLQKTFSLKFKTSANSLYTPTVKVSILQDGKEYIASKQNQEIHLTRRQFSLRFNMPIDGCMRIAAMDNENAFEIIEDNTYTNDITYFSDGREIASKGPYKTLFIDNEAHHSIYISDKPDDSRVKILGQSDNNQVSVSWEINSISMKETGKNNFTKYYIENIPLKKIYFVFYVDYNNDGILGNGEYLKTIISFNGLGADNTETEGVYYYAGAKTASNNEYIFYTDKCLYRSTIDRSHITKMNDVATSNLCLIGDNLYYCCEPADGLPFRSCISKMTIYGESREIITGGNKINEFLIIKNRIYFLDDESQNTSNPDIHLYSVNMDGTNKTLLRENLVYTEKKFLSSNGTYLYYTKTDNHRYCCRLDGTNEVMLE